MKIVQNELRSDLIGHLLNQIECVITPQAFIGKIEKIYESINKST
jgi:hypothetical protein